MLDEENLKTWWRKDLEKDSIPGIGLERTYKELIKDLVGQEVVVAVLDTKIDMLHEDLQESFWVNIDEIPGNGIDDDHNGYIDDVNGWNFLGNRKGEDLFHQSVEPTRIVRRYKSRYASIMDEKEIPNQEKDQYYTFLKAHKTLNNELADLKSYIKEADSVNALYYKAKDTIPYFTKNENYSVETIDSLIIQFPEMEKYFKWLGIGLRYGITEQDFIDQQDYFKSQLKALDVDDDARKMLDENPEDIDDAYYGNPILINNELKFQHSTGVTGLIAASRNNGLGIKGISNNIKIMPVVMVADGDEYDKDVALAIRYAVDNGAKVINMSWGKYFSSHSDWVRDAFRYAAVHDVLLVSSSGNGNKNIDIELNYPNDEIGGEEFVDNFLSVGAITSSMDSTIVASFSNYGKRTVDVFAPGEKIYTTEVKSVYQFSEGTSYASPIVAGTAALLKSYFPHLSASELKTIILESGTKLSLMVKKPGDDSAPLVPFDSLSKTGSIINIYQAFQKVMKVSR